MTRTTPLIGSTVTIKPAHLIDPTRNIGVVVALGELMGTDGSAWVRFPDGTENAFPIGALTAGQDGDQAHEPF